MKKYILILAMLLMATTAFNQTSRRTANTNTQAARKVDNRKENDQRKNTSNSANTRTRTRTTYTVNQRRAEKRPAVNTRRSAPKNNTFRQRPENNARQPRRVNQNTTGTRNKSYVSEYGRRMNASQRKNNANNREIRNTNSATRTVTHVNRTTTTYYPSQRKYYGHHEVRHHYNSPPRSRFYRAKHYPYRTPVYVNIVWTERMRNSYIKMYPSVIHWHYNIGYRIETVSAYDALYYTGEVRNVYGKVYETYYSGKTDEFFLYFGAYYPYHDFTVVVPGRIARKFSRRPDLYFENQYVMVNGLITSYEDQPEMVIHRYFQIQLY
jgi:hypothetical protein